MRVRHGFALTDDLLDLPTDVLQRDLEDVQSPGRHALPLMDQSEEDVLGPDVTVVEHPGLFLGQDHDATGPIGEALEHRGQPTPPLRRLLP